MTKKTVQRPTMNYKILCVDDEQIILDALDRLFRHVGYQYVLTAHSGELGLGILENNRDADVIIADAKSPVENEKFLSRYDVVIDDGSHLINDVSMTFKHFWRRLVKGGVYIIEDVGCFDSVEYINRFPKEQRPKDAATEKAC